MTICVRSQHLLYHPKPTPHANKYVFIHQIRVRNCLRAHHWSAHERRHSPTTTTTIPPSHRDVPTSLRCRRRRRGSGGRRQLRDAWWVTISMLRSEGCDVISPKRQKQPSSTITKQKFCPSPKAKNKKSNVDAKTKKRRGEKRAKGEYEEGEGENTRTC